MKVCSTCLLSKPLSDFNKNKTKKDGLQSFCKSCGKIRSATHYKNNKQDYNINRIKRRLIASQFVYDFLKEHPCVDCPEKDPIVLEFDHIKDKSFNISVMIHDAKPIESIKKEIYKCEVRCANCHKRKTAIQQNWYKDIVR